MSVCAFHPSFWAFRIVPILKDDRPKNWNDANKIRTMRTAAGKMKRTNRQMIDQKIGTMRSKIGTMRTATRKMETHKPTSVSVNMFRQANRRLKVDRADCELDTRLPTTHCKISVWEFLERSNFAWRCLACGTLQSWGSEVAFEVFELLPGHERRHGSMLW